MNECKTFYNVFMSIRGGGDNSNNACFERKAKFFQNLEILPGIRKLGNFLLGY